MHVLGSLVLMSVQSMQFICTQQVDLLHLQWIYGSMDIVINAREQIAGHGVSCTYWPHLQCLSFACGFFIAFKAAG